MSYNYYDNISFKTRLLNKIRSIFKIGFLENLIANLNQGKEPGSFISRLVPPEYLYRNPTWREVTRGDVRFKLNLFNVVDHNIFFGYKDSAFLNFIKLLPEDAIVFDIGANIGTTSLRYAKKCSNGTIYSYEPDEINFKRLQENIKLNAAKNIVVNNLGLGEKDEEVKLYRVSPTNPGMNRILETNEAGDFDFTTIKIKTLDSEVFEKQRLNKLDAIKIDVEGFEYRVLKGGSKSLETFKPVLFIELIDSNLKENGSSATNLVAELIENYSYEVFEAQRMQPIGLNTDLNNCRIDIIAVQSQ